MSSLLGKKIGLSGEVWGKRVQDGRKAERSSEVKGISLREGGGWRTWRGQVDEKEKIMPDRLG
jgi:hypothetical protein